MQRAKLIKAERAAEEAGTLSAEEISRLADEMKRVLPGKLKLYAPLIGVEYGRVTVRRQKSKWGSCSAQGNLNFNCLLMLAPEEVLDYVVV
ncbi:MAG: M48 family metallopeptidase, partial [Clostridia bacterium]|nr:M48 family metallopeptidase [Clostridia bacterium]